MSKQHITERLLKQKRIEVQEDYEALKKDLSIEEEIGNLLLDDNTKEFLLTDEIVKDIIMNIAEFRVGMTLVRNARLALENR